MRIVVFRLDHLKPGPRPKGGESEGQFWCFGFVSNFVLRISNFQFEESIEFGGQCQPTCL